MPKTTKLAFALLATSALVAAAAGVSAQRTATVEMARLVAAHPGLSVARVEADPFLGRVTLYGVEAVSGGTRVSIGRLRLPLAGSALGLIDSAAASPFDDNADKPEAPAKPEEPDAPAATVPAPPAAASAAPAGNGTATAENVVITTGTVTYKLTRIDLTGTPLSNADLAAILDPKSTVSVSDRLKKLTAASISIPELSSDNSADGGEQHVTEHNVTLSSVVAGRAAAITIEKTTFATKSSDDVVNGTLGTTVASGVDMAQLVHVFGTKRSDDSEPLVPLMDSVTITGGTFTNIGKNSTISFGVITEAGFAGRPLKVDPMTAAGGDQRKSNQVVDDLLHSMALKSFDAKDFALKDSESKDTFSLADLSMQGFGNGKIDSAGLSDFHFDGGRSKLSIGGVQLASVSMPGESDASSQASPFISKLDVTAVAVDTSVGSDQPDATSTHLKFALKHFAASGEKSATGTPKTGQMAFENLTFDMPAGTAAEPFVEMGYNQADVSGGGTSSYDASAMALGVKDFALDSVGMGRIGLGFDLTNVAPVVFSSDTAASKVAALAILVKGIDLKLTNAGLVEKVIAWKAKADGLTPAQERDQAVDLVVTKIPTSLGNGPNAKAIGAAVGKFITDPKTLHISAEAKTPLGAGDMALIGTPDVLIESLAVKASAND